MVEKSEGEKIGEDEAALYDRQIRLWGLEAQNRFLVFFHSALKRLRNANVLLAGLSGLGAEVAKNLTLAGLKSLTLLDDANVTKNDLKTQFLAPVESVGQNRAEASKERCQKLNPLVNLLIDTSSVKDKPKEFYSEFDIVIVIGQPYSTMNQVNQFCRELNIKFCAGGVKGWMAFTFSDFLSHEFADETKVDDKKQEDGGIIEDGGDGPPAKKPKSDDEAQQTVTVKAEEAFVSFAEANAIDWGVKSLIGKARRLPTAYFIFKALWACETKNDETIDSEKLDAEWKSILADARVKPESVKTEPTKFLPYVQSDDDMSPVCAIAGGILAQEVIKAVSQKDRPLNNFFFYNGMETTGVVVRMPPK